MIRISESARIKWRRPWRRRVSNQLAAFAAIMLFASTQISSSDSNHHSIASESAVVAQNLVAEVDGSVLEPEAILGSVTGEKSKSRSGPSKKRKRFKLDLFLFRR